MHNRIRGWSLVHSILLSVMVLAACGQVPVPDSTSASNLPGSGPRIGLSPVSGVPNTPVTIEGEGFSPQLRLAISISSASSAKEILQIGEVIAGSTGQFRLILIIPQSWPDGTPTSQDGIKITAATVDSSVIVSSVFLFTDADGKVINSATSGNSTQSTTAGIKPQITVNPPGGNAGTTILIDATGYPPSTDLVVRLGLPGAGAFPQTYAGGTTDVNGSASLSLSIPDSWPDGKPISEKQIVILVTSADGAARSLAEFTYGLAATSGATKSTGTISATVTSPKPGISISGTPPLPAVDGSGHFSQEPINVSVDFLTSLLRDPSGTGSIAFLSQRLRTEISTNWVLPTGLGIQPGYSSFEVALLASSESNAVIQATMTYESGASTRNFTMIRENGTWKIDKVVSGAK